GLVRCRYYHHRLSPAFGPEIVIEKGSDLAVPLADQRHHVHIRLAVAAHRPEQRAFPDTAAAEQADALATAARQHAVDRANASYQRLGDMLAIERAGRGREQTELNRRRDRRASIHRLAEAVEHPAGHVRAGFDTGRIRPRHYPVSQLNSRN